MAVCGCRWIEAAHPARGPDPIASAPGLDKARARVSGQDLRSVVVLKLITVETRQPFRRTEPQKAVGILEGAQHVIACQTVRCRVGPDGEPFRTERSTRNRGSHQQHNNVLHRKFILTERDRRTGRAGRSRFFSGRVMRSIMRVRATSRVNPKTETAS